MRKKTDKKKVRSRNYRPSSIACHMKKNLSNCCGIKDLPVLYRFSLILDYNANIMMCTIINKKFFNFFNRYFL